MSDGLSPSLPGTAENEIMMHLRAGCRSSRNGIQEELHELERLASTIVGRAQSLVEGNSQDVLAAINQKLRGALALMDALKHQPSIHPLPTPSQPSQPSNKRQLPQIRFHSTKAKRVKRSDISLNKPTFGEQISIGRALRGEAEVISRATHNEDHSYEAADCLTFEHSYA